MYNNQTISYLISGFGTAIFLIALVFYIATWLTYPKERVQDDAPDKKSNDDIPISGTNAAYEHEMNEKGTNELGEEHLAEVTADTQMKGTAEDGQEAVWPEGTKIEENARWKDFKPDNLLSG